MRRIRQTGDATCGLVSLLVFVLLWQVAAIVLDSSTLPAPLTVFGRVVDETVVARPAATWPLPCRAW